MTQIEKQIRPFELATPSPSAQSREDRVADLAALLRGRSESEINALCDQLEAEELSPL